MTTSFSQLQHVAKQHAQTAQLLGVDFLPVSNTSRAAVSFDQSPSTIDGMAATRKINSTAKLQALETLRAQHDATCPHCTSVTTHTQTVFGEGNPDADLMFIGEAPGEEEDRTGRPFVGRAGQKLDEIIRAMKLSREQVYIANILKSRPPENRTPLPHEIDACAPFLAQQIRIIQPKAIVALGGPASKWLLQTDIGITKLRGQWGVYDDGQLRVPVMPTFHPAYLLRNYTVDTRQKVWSDMQAALKRIAQANA